MFVSRRSRWTGRAVAGALLICLPFVVNQRTGLTRADNQSAPARLELQPCRVPHVDEELRCGHLLVYENRQTRRGRTLRLNVIVMPALDESAKGEPLFDLQGGPGLSANKQAQFYATLLRAYRRRHDVVLVDQRGTGESNPLHCSDAGFNAQQFIDDMYPPAFVKGCARQLARQADLTQYTTPIAMDDLDDVRAALGYERINLIALSYGTRAAQAYLRQHPTHVRSIVLMGTTLLDGRMPLYHARAAQRALDLLFADCAADAACRQAFPRLPQEFKQVLTDLAQRPAHVRFKPQAETGEREFTITRGFFAEQLRSHMYLPSGASQVPYLIHRAAQGDYQQFLSFALPTPGISTEDFAGGLYFSITCSEDVARINPAEIARLTNDTFLGDYRVRQQRRACRYWPQTKLPESFYAPVTSAVPVLIIVGRLDPVTPPEWAAEVASHLPNSKLVLIPADAHVPIGINFDCMDSLIVQFIDQGNAQGLDFDACAAQIKPPPFQVGPLTAKPAGS